MACHFNHRRAENKPHAQLQTHLHTMKVYNTRPVSLLLIKITLFSTTEVFTCSKVIYAFKRQNSWTDPFRKISKPKLFSPSRNMRGFGHATNLISSFHGLRQERLVPQPSFCGGILCTKYEENKTACRLWVSLLTQESVVKCFRPQNLSSFVLSRS